MGLTVTPPPTPPQSEITPAHPPDALAVVYSVIDKSSFERAEDELSRLQALDLLRNRSLVLVGNKIDVVRSRAVDEAGEIGLRDRQKWGLEAGLAKSRQNRFP